MAAPTAQTAQVAADEAARQTDDVLSAVHVLANLIGPGFAGPLGDEHGLSVAEWRVMLTLGRYPGLTAAEITTRWAMDKMAISRAIQRLEKAGHIRRARNPADRRSYRLALTDTGRALHDRVLPGAHARYREFVACLSPAEIKALGDTLAKLIAHAAELR